MHIFVTGTDTDVGKTITSTWICLHLGYDYFKPIQSGNLDRLDSDVVRDIANVKIHPETYLLKAPLSPHLAASIDKVEIDLNKISIPKTQKLVIEGAGGLLAPLNDKEFIIDLIKQTGAPVILVARSSLGTINHTLLSLEALRARNIPILGVIVNGEPNEPNNNSIEFYGKIRILATIPKLKKLDRASLLQIDCSALKALL